MKTTITGTVRKVFCNDEQTFAAVNVEAQTGRDRLWIDVCGFRADAPLLAAFEEGDSFKANITLASHKDGRGNWRIRGLLDELLTEDGPA